MTSLKELPQLAKRAEAENKKFFARLKKNHPRDLDKIVQKIHENVFSRISCLECANCCKTISPAVTDKDIERIAKFLKIRPASLTEKYFHLDNDNDYVFNDTPCPFLNEDRYCRIYKIRPKACYEYPHTDRKRFIQISDITLKNISVCPAVYEVVEKLKRNYSSLYSQ